MKIHDIIEWKDCGTEYRLYVKHYYKREDELCIQLVFEDTTRDKVTEIDIPANKVKQFLTTVNGELLSRKYEIKL